MLAWIEIMVSIAYNSVISVKKWYFSICTKGFFTIYRVTYVMLLLHDNASTLRGLTCLILWLIYIKIIPGNKVTFTCPFLQTRFSKKEAFF